MINELKIKIKDNLEKRLKTIYDLDFNIVVEEPKKANMGDLSIPVFMVAKALKKPLPECSNIVIDILKDNELIKETSFVGGFVNLIIDKEIVSKNIILDCLREKGNYGNSSIGSGQNVVIDYSSPNIAKPFSIGHLRSTIIGNSLKFIYKKLGYNVVAINHLGDWGTQFGKVIVAYQLWGSEEKVKENSLMELSKLYVKFHEEALKDDTLNDRARETFRRLEAQDPEYLRLWAWFREESLKEAMHMYDLLDVQFDSYNGEAFFNDKMEPVVNELQEKGLLKEDQGAMIVDLGENMAPAIIKRKDGATLYATRDLSALFYRKENYHFDKVLYVVGNEQKLYFEQMKKVVSLMGYDYGDQIVHVNFGLVLKDGKKMSTRQGGVVTLYEVLMESIKFARKAIEEKNPLLEDKDAIAQKIGVGAIIFNDLKNHRTLDIDFNLEQMVKFEGQTGPYLQYTGVRIASMLRESTLDENNMDATLFEKEHYYEVAKSIGQFSSIIEHAMEENAPSVVAKYLLNLAQSFNKFYALERVLVDDEKVKNTNLSLCLAVKLVLDEGMRLLGVKTLERM